MGIFTNYCGLGGEGPLKNKVDALCKEHDNLYSKLLSQGRNPYTAFNEADQGFLDQLNKLSGDTTSGTLVSIVARKFFQLKRKVARHDIDPHREHMSLSNLHESKQTNIKDHFLQTVKRQRTDNMPSFRDNKRQFHEIEDEKMEDTPVAPSVASIARASTSGGLGQETHITPIPNAIAIGVPEVTTTKLQYNYFSEDGFASAGQDATTYEGHDWVININSIYDVETKNPGQQQPKQRDFFASLYEYYTVLGLEYHVRVKAVNTKLGVINNKSDWYICHRTYGEEVPSTFVATHNTLLSDPQMDVEYLPFDNDKNTTVDIRGFFTHDDFVNNVQEIKQDANQVRWTPIGSSPALTHQHRIMPRRAIAGSSTDELYLDIKLIYTVQFKELKNTYKFNEAA